LERSGRHNAFRHKTGSMVIQMAGQGHDN